MVSGNESVASAPLVTIITPTYNCARYLRECIDSVRAQSYGCWEHIIVDDGSTDNTRELLREFADDPRIQYFHQNNRGQSAARNFALSKASGDYVCFLDADDRWLPDKLEKSLAVFKQHPGVDVVYGDMITIDENGRECSRYNMRRYSGRIAKYLLQDNCVSFSTSMARRRCFDEMGGQNEQYRLAPDWELWLRFSTEYSFYYIPEYLTYYRHRSDQISSDVVRRLDANEVILRDFLRRFPNLLSPAEKRETWCYFFTRKGRHYANLGKAGVALMSYLQALVYSPWKNWPWRALAKLIIQHRG